MEYSKSFTVADLEKYYDKYQYNNIVFETPAGTGKTTSAIEFIKKYWFKGIIYVAQTAEMLDFVKGKLLDYGIHPSRIFNYHTKGGLSDSSKLTAKECLDVINSPNKAQVLLITHSRLLFESPSNILGTSKDRSNKYNILIMDESLAPMIVADMNLLAVKNLFRNIICGRFDNGDIKEPLDYDSYEPDKTHVATEVRGLLEDYFIGQREGTNKEKKIQGRLYYPSEFSIRLNGEIETKFSDDEFKAYDELTENRLKNLYKAIANQLAYKKVVKYNDKAILVIPLSIQYTWYNKIPNFFVLDATASYLRSYFPQFTIVEGHKWNHDKIQKLITKTKHYVNEVYTLSRRNITDNPLRLNEILDSFDLTGYHRIYFVSFKDELLEYLQNYLINRYSQYKIKTDGKYTEEDYIIHLTHYGKNRGSNEFRNCECVVLFGCLKYETSLIKYYNLLNTKDTGSELTNNKVAMINFIQEIYRSRIRLDEPIDVYALHDQSFENFLNENGFETNNIDPDFESMKTQVNIPDKDYAKLLGKSDSEIEYMAKYHKVIAKSIKYCCDNHLDSFDLSIAKKYYYELNPNEDTYHGFNKSKFIAYLATYIHKYLYDCKKIFISDNYIEELNKNWNTPINTSIYNLIKYDRI